MMRFLVALLVCVVFYVYEYRSQLAFGQEGFDEAAHLTVGVTRKLFQNKNSAGQELPANQTGTLTAQLFDDLSGSEPIWQEVHNNFTSPADDVRKALVLGKTTNGFNDMSGVPIPFNKSPYLLLTFQVGNDEYVSARMAIAIAGYSHQAGAAYGAVGDLLKKIEDYERRIKNLEDANTQILKKVYRRVFGEEPPSTTVPASIIPTGSDIR
jgi:hypothetical protein